MTLLVDPQGTIQAVYDEQLDWAAFGPPQIRRASHVEPTANGQWTADLAPVNGPVLGSFALRSQALAAERIWLDTYWLRAGCQRP